MSEKEREKEVIKGIIKDFNSSDESTVLKALKTAKDKGNVDLIEPMIDLFEKTSSFQVQEEIRAMLQELKISNAITPLIENLKRNNHDVQEMILSAIWNSAFEPVEEIATICEVACNGNYMVALEALTLIENLEGPFEEEVLSEAKIVLNEYFQQPEDEKSDLIKSILGVIMSFDDGIEA